MQTALQRRCPISSSPLLASCNLLNSLESFSMQQHHQMCEVSFESKLGMLECCSLQLPAWLQGGRCAGSTVRFACLRSPSARPFLQHDTHVPYSRAIIAHSSASPRPRPPLYSGLGHHAAGPSSAVAWCAAHITCGKLRMPGAAALVGRTSSLAATAVARCCSAADAAPPGLLCAGCFRQQPQCNRDFCGCKSSWHGRAA